MVFVPFTRKHKDYRRLFLFSFIAFSFISTSSGCGIDIGTQEKVTSVLPSSEDRYEEVEFSAKLLIPLVEGDSLALDVVDEIKGIPNNITRYNMTKIDDQNYHVIISARTGSNVSYRYSKIGTITQSELTLTGKTVRYRLFHVGGTNQVKDILSGWTEGEYLGSTGQLIGTVVDNWNGAPIPDVLICIAGYQVFTDPRGNFHVSSIPEGVHNLISFPIDGAYDIYQQDIQILRDQNATISVELAELKKINVKFLVNSPLSDQDYPIRIAGNFYQFGNTFTDLNGGLNLLASRMPTMTKLDEGTYYFEIMLHAGNDLHYIFTKGDGFWNAEQGLVDVNGYRQIIIPETDITISDTIQKWQNNYMQPINFSFFAPENTPSNDTISIQFGTGSWFEPLPMIKYDNSLWKYSLFSPFPEDDTFNYRFCRNSVCDLSSNISFHINMDQINDESQIDLVNDIPSWSSWTPDNSPSTIIASNIPTKDVNYLTGIEFLPDYHPSDLESYQNIFKDLKEKGVNAIILHPSRSFELVNGNSIMYLDPHSDLFVHNVVDIGLMLDSLDMELILAPISKNNIENTNPLYSIDTIDINLFIDQYSEFILSYAQLASKLNMENFIFDLSATSPFLKKTNDGKFIDENSWSMLPDLISEIKTLFSGDVICSIPLSYLNHVPLESLLTCDEFYFLFDTTLFPYESFQDIKQEIGSIIDNQIFPIYRSDPKPIIIGFSAPSKSTELISNLELSEIKKSDTQNSGVVLEDSNLEYQALVYNAFLNEIIGRDWIDGAVARKFYGPLKLTDLSNSINGKPAMDVLWYWYTGVR